MSREGRDLTGRCVPPRAQPTLIMQAASGPRTKRLHSTSRRTISVFTDVKDKDVSKWSRSMYRAIKKLIHGPK